VEDSRPAAGDFPDDEAPQASRNFTSEGRASAAEQAVAVRRPFTLGVAMRLTRFTDNALRALLYLALEPDRVPTVGEVARRMGMSEDHLLKVVQRLSHLGYVKTIRGRNGGMRLAKPADSIVVGQVVRQTEDNLAIVPCFDPTESPCPVAPACGLAPALDEALTAFLTALDRYTVAALIARRLELRRLAQLDAPGREGATPTIVRPEGDNADTPPSAASMDEVILITR